MHQATVGLSVCTLAFGRQIIYPNLPSTQPLSHFDFQIDPQRTGCMSWRVFLVCPKCVVRLSIFSFRWLNFHVLSTIYVRLLWPFSALVSTCWCTRGTVCDIQPEKSIEISHGNKSQNVTTEELILHVLFWIPCCISPFVHRSIVSTVLQRSKWFQVVILMNLWLSCGSLVQIEWNQSLASLVAPECPTSAQSCWISMNLRHMQFVGLQN